MGETILITGGAGFIGSHLTDLLISRGYEVRILDNLCEQVHGPRGRIPDYLNPRAEMVRGDICDRRIVADALRHVDAVVHLAAAVGVGQSMYEIAKYTHVNNFGTAVLLECLMDHPVRKLVVASSMSVYGEGLYRDDREEIYLDVQRLPERLEEGLWEPVNDTGRPLKPVPTPEDKPPRLHSVYALSKFDQEKMCLLTGRAYGIPTTALRFFNVYGPRQSLSNPYTGVLAIFASRLLNGKPPLIFEDGHQQRDFVSVHDVTRACELALAASSDGEVFNIGSGRNYTIHRIADRLAKVMGRSIAPVITGKYRIGDIRHCFGDIEKARRKLDFVPRVSLEEGLSEMCDWMAGQSAVDYVDRAHLELVQRGLAI